MCNAFVAKLAEYLLYYWGRCNVDIEIVAVDDLPASILLSEAYSTDEGGELRVVQRVIPQFGVAYCQQVGHSNNCGIDRTDYLVTAMQLPVLVATEDAGPLGSGHSLQIYAEYRQLFGVALALRAAGLTARVNKKVREDLRLALERFLRRESSRSDEQLLRDLSNP